MDYIHETQALPREASHERNSCEFRGVTIACEGAGVSSRQCAVLYPAAVAFSRQLAFALRLKVMENKFCRL